MWIAKRIFFVKRMAVHTCLFLLCHVSGGFGLMGQTVNNGLVYVSSNTVFSSVAHLTNNDIADLLNDGDMYLYGDFVNQGLVDFVEEGAGLHLVGTSGQNIQASDENYFRFYDLSLRNGNGYSLNGEMRIAGKAEFEDGVLGGDGLLLFENGSSFAGASHISYADIGVQKEGGNSFQFPVGDGGYYRPLLLEGMESVSESFKVRYLLKNPDELYPVESMGEELEMVGDTEYWQLDRVAGSSPVTLTLGWNENTTSSELLGDGRLDAVRIVRWDEILNQWVNIGGVVDVAARNVSVPAVNQFGVFALAKLKFDDGVVLNEELIYNGITPNGDGVNDYFLIENIDEMPNNVVEVYNRWSIKVFETKDYDSSGNVFEGFAESGLTFGGARLPGGTYYYLVSFDSIGDDGSVKRISKMGFIYLNY